MMAPRLRKTLIAAPLSPKRSRDAPRTGRAPIRSARMPAGSVMTSALIEKALTIQPASTAERCRPARMPGSSGEIICTPITLE
jgi:hypothetical protein